MIDFTDCLEKINGYRGSEMKKTLIYDNKKYLVKLPDPVRQKNKNISYINNTFSEYVGSNIFRLIGFEVQNTLLGIYNYNGKEKIVCACEDFTTEDNVLHEFESVALGNNFDKKIDTELSDILEVLNETKININVEEVKNKFFDMFIVDSLIGNTDRHNGNWGFLINDSKNEISFSPIYDCGSCLNPMLEDSELEEIDKNELKNLAVNCFSCLKINSKRINYISYIKSMCNDEVNRALLRVMPKVNIDEINNFIDNIECISKVRKEFYKNIIKERYLILNNIYNKLNVNTI